MIYIYIYQYIYIYIYIYIVIYIYIQYTSFKMKPHIQTSPGLKVRWSTAPPSLGLICAVLIVGKLAGLLHSVCRMFSGTSGTSEHSKFLVGFDLLQPFLTFLEGKKLVHQGVPDMTRSYNKIKIMAKAFFQTPNIARIKGFQ